MQSSPHARTCRRAVREQWVRETIDAQACARVCAHRSCRIAGGVRHAAPQPRASRVDADGVDPGHAGDAGLAWPNEAMERDFERSVQQESPVDFPRGADGVVRYPHLALSGGGANGAFGAGFLAGWSATGRLPVFKMVTGVSTGALMAPFAFLGPQYDAALHKFYTTTATRDIFAMRSILISLVRGYSLADTGPLAALITRHVDAEFLRQVGDAHNRGRRLYIGTVDLDSQQFVVWNTGLIAARGGPEALDLVRKVMLASAAIPIAFPPEGWPGERGFVTAETLKRHLPADRNSRDYFICGQDGMIDAVERALTDLGVSLAYIHSERYNFV